MKRESFLKRFLTVYLPLIVILLFNSKLSLAFNRELFGTFKFKGLIVIARLLSSIDI